MHIYRFRILLEDHEEFIRDIEIKSTQTYEDFHKIIQSSVDAVAKELASFFICDRRWNKQREITLKDMKAKSVNKLTDDDDDDDIRGRKKKIVLPVVMMKQALIKDFIDDPHQRMIYEYDYLNNTRLYIELTKIIAAEPKVEYPRCIFRRGSIIKVPPAPIIPVVEEEVAEDNLLAGLSTLVAKDLGGDSIPKAKTNIVSPDEVALKIEGVEPAEEELVMVEDEFDIDEDDLKIEELGAETIEEDDEIEGVDMEDEEDINDINPNVDVDENEF